MLYQVTPIYIAEISPEKMRGSLMSLLNVYGAISFLVSIYNIQYNGKYAQYYASMIFMAV